ncbi:hypothetical protein R3P38DRAFT_47953 [Favolaschia claudopus]|uniref:Uncharacterized protein n=1 Tax=Favolaschia claudopus TaxID=2862362 RepID=A0AAW0EIG3_9AGAR
MGPLRVVVSPSAAYCASCVARRLRVTRFHSFTSAPDQCPITFSDASCSLHRSLAPNPCPSSSRYSVSLPPSIHPSIPPFNHHTIKRKTRSLGSKLSPANTSDSDKRMEAEQTTGNYYCSFKSLAFAASSLSKILSSSPFLVCTPFRQQPQPTLSNCLYAPTSKPSLYSCPSTYHSAVPFTAQIHSAPHQADLVSLTLTVTDICLPLHSFTSIHTTGNRE